MQKTELMNTELSHYTTSEDEFSGNKFHDISHLWQSRNEGKLRCSGEKSIYWVSLCSQKHSRAVVIVNGRVESVWKYQELFYDFFQNGYDVYSFDHRGQGLSDRIVPEKDMGHVESFSDYVDDLDNLVTYFDLSRYEKSYLVAHSMGGAVSTRYLQLKNTQPFSAVALSAPMHGINIAWYLKPISSLVMRLKAKLQAEPDYATSHKGYYAKPFEGNPLSHSFERYKWFRQLYEKMPELKVGGPSSHWVWQSLLAAKECRDNATKISPPLLLLQASEDKIVSNTDQARFYQRLQRKNKNARLLVVKGAKHELFFEKDDYRNIALTNIFEFFDKF